MPMCCGMTRFYKERQKLVRGPLRLLAAITVIAFVHCAVAGEIIAPNADASSVIVAPTLDASTVITLERGPCIGRCPEYAVTMYGSGEVEFEGKRYVCAKGRHTAKAPRDEVRRLVLQMLAAGYFDLTWPAGPITTDQPTVRSSFRHGGRVREIEHDLGDAHAPRWLRTLEDRIDAIAGTSRWLPDREDHRPMCNKEGGFREPLES